MATLLGNLMGPSGPPGPLPIISPQPPADPVLGQLWIQPLEAEPPPLLMHTFSQVITNAYLAEAPYIRPGDRFSIVTGNAGNATVDMAFVNSQAAQLKAAFPQCECWAFTVGNGQNGGGASGNHFQLICQGASSDIDGAIYGYEPDFPNQPEFSWNWATTQTQIAIARGYAVTAGMPFGIGPTTRSVPFPGNPNSEAVSTPWNMGTMMGWCDYLALQTQAWATPRVDWPLRWINALTYMRGQGLTDSLDWSAQLTVSEVGVTQNGVDAPMAVGAWAAADAPRMGIWTANVNVSYAAELLHLLRPALVTP